VALSVYITYVRAMGLGYAFITIAQILINSGVTVFSRSVKVEHSVGSANRIVVLRSK